MFTLDQKKEIKAAINKKISSYLEGLKNIVGLTREEKETKAKERAAKLKKEDMADCSIQHLPSALTIPERVIKKMKTKNISACLVRYNNIWFSPARLFGAELNKGFENKEEKKETKEEISFNSADYINLSERHPELEEETSGIEAKKRPETMVGRFFERRKRGAQKLAKSVGKGASHAGKKIMKATPMTRAVLTLGMVGEDSKPPEAYDFGDTKEIKINIKDVDHGEFPIKPFTKVWDAMSDIKSDKVIQVNWTNTTKEDIKTVDGGYIDVRNQIRDNNKRPGDTLEFTPPGTSKEMTIVVPDDYKPDSELKVKLPNHNDNIVLMHPVYLLLISIKNPYNKPIKPGQTVRLYLRGTLNDVNSTIPEEKPNFILLNNQVSNNIAQIIFDEGETDSFSIEEIKHNLAYYMYEIIHKKQLISLYDIYSALSKNLKPEEKKSRKIFAEHEQFAILKKADNKNIKRRIFYRKDITPLKDDIDDINRNSANIYIYVFDSESVFPGKNICLNKKYGVINVNGKFWELDKVKKTKEYDDLKSDSDLNEACNLTFSGKKSNIYVMSLQELIRREQLPIPKALKAEKAEKEAAKAKTNRADSGANPDADGTAGGNASSGAEPGAGGNASSGAGGAAGVASTLKNRLAIALAIAIKNNIEHMKKRGKEAAEDSAKIFKKLLEELKKAVESQKGDGKQKKKIQKGGNQNSTRSVKKILEEMASYIKKYPNTIPVLKKMVENYGPEVKKVIEEEENITNIIKESEAAAQQPEENPTPTPEAKTTPKPAPQPVPEPAPEEILSDGIKDKLDNKVLSAKKAVKEKKQTKVKELEQKVADAQRKLKKAQTKEEQDVERLSGNGMSLEEWDEDQENLGKAQKELKEAEKRLKEHEEK